MSRIPRTQSLSVDSHRSLHSVFSPTHLHLSDSTGNRVEWQSRRARKGRYSVKAHYIHDSPSLHRDGSLVYLRLKSVEGDLKPHLLVDISFWIAVIFTLGSMVWVVNGFLVWMPFVYPNMSSNRIEYSAAALAFIGGTIFDLGSYLMVVEALDRGRETNFGTALSRLLHSHRRMSVAAEHSAEPSQPSANEETSDKWPAGAKGFVWWGKPLWHELGYLAALVQLCGASVFWIATITGLPSVIPGLYDDTSSIAITDVFYWTPQVIGGSGFIISSVILLLEVQHQWWLPKPLDIGWQVGFWNLVGAVGFTLCGALGYSSTSGALYQSALSTFWGSWAFLIGSAFQVWEVVWREPPE